MAGIKPGKGSRRSREAWRAVLVKFDGSGLDVETFCRREAISRASLYRWRGRLSDVGEAAVSPQAPAFVDLGALNSAPSARPQLDLKLDLGDGLVLHLVRR